MSLIYIYSTKVSKKETTEKCFWFDLLDIIHRIVWKSVRSA